MKAKYPLLPRHIIKQLNGRYRCSKTLKWYTTKELEIYSLTEAKKQQETKEIKQNALLEKRWDLKY